MRYLALVAIVFLSGCSPDSTVPGTTVRDSAGVTVVENPKVAPEFDWALTDVPVMEIGGALCIDLPESPPRRLTTG